MHIQLQRPQGTTGTRRAFPDLVDITRMEDAAIAAGRSAEALFGYLSRLDALRAASLDLGGEALADRAAEAELHMRVVLSAGMDAVNELQDLGLLEHALRTTAADPAAFNKVKLTDVVEQIATAFRERMPEQRWDWLANAGKLVEGIEVRVEADGEGLRGTVTHAGKSSVTRLSLGASVSRVRTEAFFSAGPDRVYVPTSAIFAPVDETPAPVAAYDAVVGRLAFAREWVYRHARNARELGPPAWTGGGGVAAVIAIVVAVIVALATIAEVILSVVCFFGSAAACTWAGVLGMVASVLSGAGLDPVDVVLFVYGLNQE
jgi:hypothetical protein